jgi:hypothetical protein
VVNLFGALVAAPAGSPAVVGCPIVATVGMVDDTAPWWRLTKDHQLASLKESIRAGVAEVIAGAGAELVAHGSCGQERLDRILAAIAERVELRDEPVAADR